MTHSVEFKRQVSQHFKRFQQFVFVGDSGMKLVSKSTRQLKITSNSGLLAQAAIGDCITVEKIYAPQSIICQLKSLEFEPEKRVQLVSKTSNGSVIVSLNNTLIGIGTEIAQRIVVTLVGEAKS